MALNEANLPLAEISTNHLTAVPHDEAKIVVAQSRHSTSSPQAENDVLTPDEVRVDFRGGGSAYHGEPNHLPQYHHEAGRVQSCMVEFSSSSGLASEGSTSAEHQQQQNCHPPPKPRRTKRASMPAVMTTQTALVQELKDVLRRKSKFVEVVPDPNNPSPDFDDDDEDVDDDGGYTDEESDELAHVGGVVVSSPETSRNQQVSSPFSTASGTRTATPQMPQMVRNVRCAITGDEADQFFNDCQTSANHSYKRTFELQHDGALVNLQIVAVIGMENRDELPRFKTGNSNCDVFLTVFKDESSLRETWLPQIRRFNSELPIVVAGGMPQPDGKSLASTLGAKDYVDLSASSDVKPVFETVIAAVLGPARLRPLSALSNGGIVEIPLEQAQYAAQVAATPPPSNEANGASKTMDQVDGESKQAKKPAAKCCCTIQ